MEGNSKVIVHLSLIPGIGPAALVRLLAVIKSGTIFGDSYTILYDFSQADLQNYGKLNQETARRIAHGLACKRLLEEELELIDRHKISLLTLDDTCYPELLKEIHLPPMILYSKGTGDFSFKQQIAIVGSRSADHYGMAVITSYVPEFVAAGYTIVSGGALGVDSWAHQRTIQSAGVTGAVLGSGLLRPYPAENDHLFDKIVDSGGYLMSSLPLRMEPLPQFFPARNRIIAGLSRGTLVVQAAERSGALITARFALEEGREVFAVPGRVDSPLSAGCHALLSEGAIVASSASAVLSSFNPESVRSHAMEKKVLKKPASSHEKHQMVISSSADNSDPQMLVYSLCFEPQSVEDLISKSGLDMATLQEHLWSLMAEGKMTQSAIGLWKCV